MSGYETHRVTAADPALEQALSMLEREFASRGELERRSVIESWLARGARSVGHLELDYHLLVARSQEGELAAVRDCHTVIDRENGRGVLYLAHVVVAREHRQRGIAKLMRDAPIREARALLPLGELVIAAEMEHPRLEDEESIVRLIAYGRAGFRAVSPAAMPYWQPDFRDPTLIDTPRPVPLLAVVKPLGHDEPTFSKTLAEMVLVHLYAVFADHCREEHLAEPRADTLAALAAWPEEDVPLLPMPASIDDHAAVRALFRPC